MQAIKELVDWELVRAKKFHYTTSLSGSESLFEIINAVIFAISVWEALNTVKIVGFEPVFDSIFNHVPLDQILSVELFHIFFIGTRKEVDNFVAISHEHGSA